LIAHYGFGAVADTGFGSNVVDEIEVFRYRDAFAAPVQ
jgi:hypothetical protein